jgi:transcriptional regulator with XRE-family HTH domain
MEERVAEEKMAEDMMLEEKMLEESDITEQRQRTGLFASLKQVLKAQGIRYKDLAEKLNTSEPTIKRLFSEQDCKLSRLMEVCEVIGISFTELVDLAAKQPINPSTLSLATEQALAAKPGLISFFMLLVSEFDLDSILEHNHLTVQDGYLYLRELEKLDLIRLRQDDSYYFRVDRPIAWRLDGPLHPILVKVNQGFIKESISQNNNEHYPFYSASRLLSPNSIKQLSREVDGLYQAFQKQAALDQMFYPREELLPYKMVSTLGPFDLVKYFKVPAFNGNNLS